jgi:hypothetical protein
LRDSPVAGERIAHDALSGNSKWDRGQCGGNRRAPNMYQQCIALILRECLVTSAQIAESNAEQPLATAAKVRDNTPDLYRVESCGVTMLARLR